MSKPISFAQAEYDAKRKTTRRDRFLAEMDIVVPWARLLAVLSPHDYPAAGKGPGRPSIGWERMLRLYFLPLLRFLWVAGVFPHPAGTHLGHH